MAESAASSLYGLSSGNGKNLTARAYILLFLLCLCFFVPGQVSLPPTDRDESLFAQATKQMIETHDYVDINYLGTPRYKKPVGIYWLQAASVQLLNPHNLTEIWPYRVPSLISAIIAVLMTAALGALLFNSITGLTAAVMLASCLDLNIEAHLAKTDAALLAAVMVAQYALARAYILSQSGCKNAFSFWSAIGIGILIKGPIVLLTVGSTLFWLYREEKNLDWLMRLKPKVGIPYALLLVAPWFIAINLASHGAFAAQSGGHDFLGKIFQGQDRSGLPPGAHALMFTAMFFPFSLFALLSIPDLWAARHERSVRFCLGWLVPTWLMFEISLNKLPHYVLPVYPCIAILTAKCFLDGYPALAVTTRRWWPVVATTVWIIAGMVLAIGLAALPAIVDHAINPVQIAGSFILLTAQGAGMLLYVQHKKLASVTIMTIGVAVFSVIVFTTTLPDLHRMWLSRDIVREARAYAPCADFKIVSGGYGEPSLAFLAGTSTKVATNGIYAAAEMQHDPCRVGVIKRNMLREFLTYGSRDFPSQPVPVGTTVEGFSMGRNKDNTFYFYVLPQKRDPTPVYP